MFKYNFRSLLLGLLLGVCVSPSAFAIRSVGNGGGLAEMRVIYLFQNINRFLKICLNENNTCQLPTSSLTEWQSITQEKNQSQNDYELSFENKLVTDKGFSVEGKSLKISHQALYEDLTTPKKFHELLAFTISIKQELLGSVFSFNENLQIAVRTFKNLKIEEHNHKIAGLSSLLKLSQLKVFNGQSSHLIIGLEDEQKTINLADAVKKVLPCGQLASWSFNQWSSSVVANTAYFYGFATAICEGQQINRRIIIKTTLDIKLLVDENTLAINFFAN